MLKILHVVNVAFVIPYFLGSQLSYMKKRGYDISVVCSPSAKNECYSRKYDFSYMEVPILRKFSFKADIKAIIDICRYIKANKVDIVNGHTPKGGLLAMCAAFIMRVPKRIYFRHGLLHETAKGWKKWIFVFSERFASALATDVVCVSPYLIERSIAEHLSPPLKMKLLNKGSCNGVDAYKQFNPQNVRNDFLHDLRTKYNLPNDAWVIGYTGRLVCDKGIVELIEAFLLLKNKIEGLYLLLVGPEEERDSLPCWVKEQINCDSRIICTGLIEEHIEYYYAMMNVLVLATHREGLGTSILEASAMEIPILTTSYTGSRDAVIDMQTGFYIDSVDTIVEKVLLLNNDIKLANRLGKAGRSFMLRDFDQHIIWNEIEKLYYYK